MPGFTAAEQALIDVWDAHTAAEFEQKDADAAIATMTEQPVLIHVPVGTGATGREPLRNSIGRSPSRRCRRISHSSS